MSDDSEVRIGEEVAGRRHYPRYTKGCWGAHGHKVCWLCKLRVPIDLIRILTPTDE